MAQNESSQWRGMLKPLVVGLIALAAAGTSYLKSSSETSDGLSKADEKLVRIEVKQEIDEASINDLKAEMELLRNENVKLNASVSALRTLVWQKKK